MLAVGDVLQGRYRIVREIGAGGMGMVYEGENLRIRRRVAIKVMRSNGGDNAELVARFEREAQIASQIPSDHITEVLDLGELPDGHHFIVMEYLAGESLALRLERAGTLPPRQLVPLVRQVLVGLSAAHRAGVVHRDIKPDNIFVLHEKAGQSDFVKLMDFGISKLSGAAKSVQLTQTGAVVGTPNFMSPEQLGGASNTSALSDLYAVGVVLYRGLTGEVPFKAQQFNDLIYKIALGEFVPPSARVPGLDPELSAIVCKAMARAPEQRFQSAEQFIAALDGWAERVLLLTPGRMPTPLSNRIWEGAALASAPPPGSTPPRSVLGAFGTFGGVGAEPPLPSASFGPTTHVATPTRSGDSQRKVSRLFVTVVVASVLALCGAVFVFLPRAPVPAGSAPEPSVRVFASEPERAATGAAPAAPTPAAPTPASSAASSAAPVGTAPLSVEAKSERSRTEPQPSENPATVARERKPSASQRERSKPSASAKPQRQRRAPDKATPKPAASEPAAGDDERPDWGY
jgi:eukaryotic-like serine/threonine-protein kinase